MKNWQSFSALKRVKNETENLTVALANALENVIVTPAGEEKSLRSLEEPVQSFAIIPGIMQLLEFPNLAMLVDEIHDLLHDTINHSDLGPDNLESRLQIAYVATSSLPALLEDSLKQSSDSFAKVFLAINQVRKTWDCAAIFDGNVLSARQKISFRKQFAASPDKMKDMLAKQAALFVKAGKALLDDSGNDRAQHALRGVATNMELILRDCRFGTLWGLAAAVIETLQTGNSNENALNAVIALGNPLQLLATGDLSQLDNVDENIQAKLLDVVSGTQKKSMRLAIIRQWYGLDKTAARQMKTAFRNVQVRYARKSALNNSLRLINEDINALVDAINVLIESGQVTLEKVGEIYQRVFSLRSILVFLHMNYLADHIDQTLHENPGEPLEDALSQAAGVLFVINKELVDKLENLEREVFSSESAMAESSSLGSARLHVYLTAMGLLETVITDIDTYVDNGCQGSDLHQAGAILDELACVFTVVTLKEQQQYLVTARDYVALVAQGVGEEMPDASFNALSHLVINSLGYLEQLSIGREQDSRAYLEKSGRFAEILQAFVDAHPTPEPDNDPEPDGEPEPDSEPEPQGIAKQTDAGTSMATDSGMEAVTESRADDVETAVEALSDEIEPASPQDTTDFTVEADEEAPAAEPPPIETVAPEAVPEADEPDNTQPATTDDSEDIDDEIKEIFAEEFDEVLDNLREELASLGKDFQQPQAIKDCCRYFHTLKGSGRMVGAEIIGTLSLAMEKLYDYLGDQPHGMNDEITGLTGRVLDTLPGMKEHFMDASSAPAPDPALIQQLCQEAVGFMSAEAAAEVEIPVLQAIVKNAEVTEASTENHDDTAAGIPIVTESVPTLSDTVDMSGEELEGDGEDISAPEDIAAGAEVDRALVSRELKDINNTLSTILAGNEEPTTTSDLQAPLHTLYGIARMQQLDNYANAVRAMEKFQETHPRKTITADMALVFHDFCLLTDKVAWQITKGDSTESAELAFDAIDLEQALAELSQNLQQPGATRDTEAEEQDPVLAGFLREARDLVAKLEQEAEVLTNDPTDTSTLDNITQTLHLLAGAAEAAEIETVEKLAATMEAVYARPDQQDSGESESLRALLAEGHVWLAGVPGQLESGQQLADSTGLCDRLLTALAAPVAEAPAVIPQQTEPQQTEPQQTKDEEVQEPEQFSEPEEAVDQSLMAVFLDEADEILEALDDLYLRWQEGDEGVIDEYLRHLHTLKGSSALVLEKQLSKAAHEYETFIIDARNKKQGYDADFFATSDGHLHGLQEIYRLYSRDASGMIVRQPSGETQSAGEASPALQTAVVASEPDTVADAVIEPGPEKQPEPVKEPEPEQEPEPEPVEEPEQEPEPVQEPEQEPEPVQEPEPENSHEPHVTVAAEIPTPEKQEDPVDQTLMDIYLDEANEILEAMDSLYLRWQEGDEGVIDEYLRHLHTLKGSSALVREMDMSKGAHEFETLIIDTRNAKQGYDAEFFIECDTRMQGLQEIYRLYSRDDHGQIVKAAGKSMPATSGPASAASSNDSPAGATPELSPSISLPEDAVTSAASPDMKPAQMPRAEPRREKSTQNIQAAVDEQVRVSSQLLKNLMNDADEINFSRNRIEKSFTDISTLLGDMDETLNKVRSYVKRFEEKARESYTTAVEENTGQPSGRISDEFDALEMDRYTELHEMSLSLTEDYDDLQDIRMNLGGRLKDIDNVLLGQQRLTNSLQDGLISSQMVPFSSIVPRLRRLVRQISRELKKDVRFEVENQQGNLDKNVLQAIITPFEHLIRNALDHGIEPPAERKQAGKEEQAVLSVRVTRVGASILIEIRDDGRGINVVKVKSRAIERGIIEKDADISHAAACNLIFKPGFSTADAVSSISGRGVGLDVVKSEITQIGGTVEISSEQGVGTAFIIQLPLTTSLNRSLMFDVQGQHFVVLMNTLDGVKVEKLSRILQKQQDNEVPAFEYGGKTYEYAYLGKLLNPDVQAKLESVDTSIPMLLVSGKDRNFALHIDAITESRDLVVKSFSKQLAAIPGIGGGVIMPDSNVAVVLDLVMLVNQISAEDRTVDLTIVDNSAAKKAADNRRQLIMVVDDSITVRKVTTSTLKRHGFDVITAKNGMEAIEQLEANVPDVILLDIEMPKMDGFETAAHIRKQDAPIGMIPIIMITSRIGDKHRTRAQEIGVNEFMSKPFVEKVLIEHIHSYRK